MRKATFTVEVWYDEDDVDSDGDQTTAESLQSGLEAGLDNEVPNWTDYSSYTLTLAEDVEVDA